MDRAGKEVNTALSQNREGAFFILPDQTFNLNPAVGAGLLPMEGASVVAVATTAPRLERHVAPKQWEGGSSGSKTAQPH